VSLPRQQQKKVSGLFSVNQGQNLALAVLLVPYSLESGGDPWNLALFPSTERLQKLKGFSSESQGPNMAVTVLYVPSSLDSGGKIRLQRRGRGEGRVNGYSG